MEQAKFIFDNAKITGIAPSGTEEIIFSAVVGESSGLFTRPIHDNGNDCEGHIIHDRGILFQDITTSADGRMAFSIRNKNGEHNIAIAEKNSGQYRELTEGDSIDRNPFWDPQNADRLLYDSAPVAYGNNGVPMIGSRSTMRLSIKNAEIEEIIGSDDYDYVNPQADKEGNIWCIRRPYHKQQGTFISPLDLLLMPFKIGRALFGAIEFFTLRHTGEPLISSGANPSKIRYTPKDLFFDGQKINAERTLNLNMKSGDSFPGYIPKNWELIRIEKNDRFSVQARSVCSFTVLTSDVFLYSNGKYLFKSVDGEQTRIAEAVLPTKIVVI